MYQNGRNITFIDRNNSSVNMFLREARKHTPLTTDKEYELWCKMRQSSRHAKDQLINANLRYVVTIAKKYLASGTPFEDLLMAGSLGITRAADMFDASLGYRFISFATWYIECEVRKAAYDHLRHKSVSLDEPIDADDCDSPSLADYLHASSDFSSDWQLRYVNTLAVLKSGLDKHYCQGYGDMLDDYLTMSQKGYTPSDFAIKYHLSETQMQHFLHMLRHESRQVLKAA
jgi:RNA polymerase sigma factor (sigma-70 family)